MIGLVLGGGRTAAGGAPRSCAARSSSAEQASAVSGVSSLGFHTTLSPQTSATAAFQDQTATGKLNAEMTATTPAGCQVSISRCPGRSDGMVRPSSWRDSPSAKSQMSIISWTSPRASERIFPTSTVTRSASASRCSSSSRPNRLTSEPRTGAGTERQVRKAAWVASIAAATSSAFAAARPNRVPPSIGERAVQPSPSGTFAPQADSAASARARSCSWELIPGIVPADGQPVTGRRRLAGCGWW